MRAKSQGSGRSHAFALPLRRRRPNAKNRIRTGFHPVAITKNTGRMPVQLLKGQSDCVFADRRRGIARYLIFLALSLVPFTQAADPFELIPRETPFTPEQSLAAFEIEGPYKLELVAAEPLVTDPVELCFDEKGRMYVAEMGDYPLGPKEGMPPLSRIRLLEDTDGDGRMDTSTVWADHLEYVQGLILVNGGVLATTWNAIVFLKDTDGDDRADLKQTLFVSDEPKHSQAIISSPRWGPGMQIYFNNGLNTQNLIDQATSQSINVSKSGIRVDPYQSWKLSVTEGLGQYGATFNELGDHFYTTNRNPIKMTVLPREFIQRNPYSGLNSGQTDVYPVGATIYPAAITLTASVVHAGSYTAACGTHSYQGNALPNLRGDLLVCDPTAQLVSRHRLSSRGGTYKATAIRKHPQSEFIRSRDPWTRPVNLASGPDGALYLCDMYRRFIDHPMFLHQSYSERFDMQTGSNLGRIYRLVPKDPSAIPENRTIPIETPEKWPSLLQHDNQWHRTTASRLIRESQNVPRKKIHSLLENTSSPHGQQDAFRILESKGLITSQIVSTALASQNAPLARAALDYLTIHPDQTEAHQAQLLSLADHSEPRIAFLAIATLGSLPIEAIKEVFVRKLLESPNDPWLQSTILSHRDNVATEILIALLLQSPATNFPASLVSRFSEATSREADPKKLSALLAILEAPLAPSVQFAILDGIDSGLRFQKRMPQITSLRSLIEDPPQGIPFRARVIQSLSNQIAQVALDTRAEPRDRIAAITLVRTLPTETARELFGKLIAFDQTAETQKAAMQIANHLPRETVSNLLFDQWNALGSTAQTSALQFLNTTDKTRLQLLEKMKLGLIPKSLLDPMSRWRYLRSKNESLKSIAQELFSAQSSDRQSLVTEYLSAVPMNQGDPLRGLEHFATNCSLCHSFRSQGNPIGPDITDVRNKPLPGLLTDILDPNRVVETQFSSYLVDTKDGRSLMGIITEENENGIVLVAPGIKEEIPYSQIESKRATGLSLMPPGLEAAIDPQAMADLIAYLTN